MAVSQIWKCTINISLLNSKTHIIGESDVYRAELHSKLLTNLPFVRTFKISILPKMSARPVVKTSHMSAAMQEFAIMAAQVWNFLVMLQCRTQFTPRAFLDCTGCYCQFHHREWNRRFHQTEIWAAVSFDVSFIESFIPTIWFSFNQFHFAYVQVALLHWSQLRLLCHSRSF